MAKAYDRVEWSFLNAVMRKLGFDDVFCQWVMECVLTVLYNVVINGEAKGNIKPSRGLRQGDPLSPFLFLLCAKGFSCLIHNEERVDRRRGITVSALAEPISHVFFADDSVLFFSGYRDRGSECFEDVEAISNVSGLGNLLIWRRVHCILVGDALIL